MITNKHLTICWICLITAVVNSAALNALPIATSKSKLIVSQSSKGSKKAVLSLERQNDGHLQFALFQADRCLLKFDSWRASSDFDHGASDSIKRFIRQATKYYWRNDGKALVIDEFVNSEVQEQIPHYIVWDGGKPRLAEYDVTSADVRALPQGATTRVSFSGWSDNGAPLFRREKVQ